jgi:hypothetical protein
VSATQFKYVRYGQRGTWPSAVARAIGATIPAVVVAACLSLASYPWSQYGPHSPVMQRALLTEEPANAAGSVSFGASVIWRLVEAGGGVEIVGNIDIPLEDTRIALAFRKNADETLPASNIVELRTSVSRPGEAVSAVGGLVVKGAPDAPGVLLLGSVADMGDGLFWIGLSPVPSDVAFNMQVLATGQFFDLSLTYSSGKQATLTFEKGRSGYPIFQNAVAAWIR